MTAKDDYLGDGLDCSWLYRLSCFFWNPLARP
jgi:hypothetical protein